MLIFKWDKYSYSTITKLTAWEGFQSRGFASRTVLSSQQSDGSVEIILTLDRRDDDLLTSNDLASVDWLIENQSVQAKAALKGLIEDYTDLIWDIEDLSIGLPETVEKPEDFHSRIGLCQVHIHNLLNEGIPYIGYEFGCDWDEEHGLGILMHGERVVSIGGADTALLLWIAEDDAGIAREEKFERPNNSFMRCLLGLFKK